MSFDKELKEQMNTIDVISKKHDKAEVDAFIEAYTKYFVDHGPDHDRDPRVSQVVEYTKNAVTDLHSRNPSSMLVTFLQGWRAGFDVASVKIEKKPVYQDTFSGPFINWPASGWTDDPI